MRKNIFCALLLSISSVSCFADDYGSSFTLFPTQVVFQNPGKVAELTMVNLSDAPLNTQSQLKTMEQYTSGVRLVESNELLSGSPSIVVTPSVVQNLAPNAKQAIRLLAIRQNPESEIAYRLFVKNLTPRSIDSTGTTFEIQYGFPVFVLPKNINESYQIAYTKINGKPYLKTTNTGNVHVQIKEVYVQSGSQKASIGTVGRLLAGQSSYLLIPETVEKSVAKDSNISINFAKSGLIDFDKESQVVLSIKK